MLPGIPILEDADIARAIAGIDALAAMRALFLALGEERAVQPPQTLTLFPGGAGDFITYLGVMADAQVFGAKLSPYIVQPKVPLVTAWTLLMSMQSGRPLLLCDASRLTVERTAATTALAVDLLAAGSVTQLTIVGSGAIAQAHLRQVRSLRDWTRIRVYSPRLYEHPDKQAGLRAIDPRVSFAPTLAAATDNAEVVLLCTSSGIPVLDPGTLRRPALITSISTNVADAHEIPPAALAAMDIFCDYRATTPLSAGEMRLAAARHGWSPAAVRGDLGALAVGAASPPTYERHVFFRSIGLGLEDVAMAYALLQGLQPAMTGVRNS